MASSPDSEAGAAMPSLLLVDDDAPFRQRLLTMLSRKGFAVTATGSLADARVEAARLKPEYAIVDMRLEDGNGLDLARIIHQTGHSGLASVA